MTDKHSESYQVLARKYRPETFTDLVGQDAMVQTLKNAFVADRIAQAFIMTGIRGTGKTTTARIIAKGLNCTGPDGSGNATTNPCGVCDPCSAIMQGRHVDVMEMDAASRTGVSDIREIIDSVHYRAASARYKIYIIDEVHMLSTSAFNALLKTLEEPPPHAKFIFATTEIRKVPVTVLSRCQRFDLRRIEPEIMIALMQKIAKAEAAQITNDSLALITRAAEGSARDATSLLDQAISHGAGETTAEQVRAMLGMADRSRVMDLFDFVMKGDANGALSELSSQYADGADPMAVLKDLAEITHWISVVKITPNSAEDPTLSPSQRVRGQAMATALPMRALTRMWQLLLKALDEVAQAPNAMMAAEMAIIRLTHVADMPSPEELIRKLQSGAPLNTLAPGQAAMGAIPGETAQNSESANPTAQSRPIHGTPDQSAGSIGEANAHATDAKNNGQFASASHSSDSNAVPALPINQTLALYPSFEHVIDLIRVNRDVKLLVEVESGVQLACYQPGRIEFVPTESAPNDLAQRLGQRLQLWTGNRWAVSLVNEGGADTIAARRHKTENALKAEAQRHPLFQAVLAEFPAAKITKIR
ncbi:MAG: DNA polymerase III subunit gamma/tau, partial [Paracoccaceae bacterium]|nr:DNA polymerase III subunit gamma/tau [Paracoccaceae bacterium]